MGSPCVLKLANRPQREQTLSRPFPNSSLYWTCERLISVLSAGMTPLGCLGETCGHDLRDGSLMSIAPGPLPVPPSSYQAAREYGLQFASRTPGVRPGRYLTSS